MPSPSVHPKIAIIGAGLSGLTLALALHQRGLTNITIYEGRNESLDIGGAIMLSPNALKVLDALDIYARLRPLGFEFESLDFRQSDNTPVDTFEFGSFMKYGYKALRVYRYEIIDILHELVREKEGITIEYGKKFARVISEEGGVTWEFSDGSEESASFLVGADGIHSQVRKHIYPDLEPRFTGAIGVTAAVPTAQLNLPTNYSTPVTIMNREHGAFVISQQLRDGSECLIGKQRRFQTDLSKQGWVEVLENKDWCIDFLREGAENFPELVKNAVSDIPKDKINLWPFYVVPKLDTWVSRGSRVVILGDAAHAIPPTAGQGVNQAFEDVYTFAGVVAALSKKGELHQTVLAEGLRNWQAGRQVRIDKVLELNGMIDKRRMPKAVSEGKEEEEIGEFELTWLYDVDFEQMIVQWAAPKVKSWTPCSLFR
jgi:2-polyprenyl-6-methoxyphenol hydroxylase-like FAD-dependent oxidoreductase